MNLWLQILSGAVLFWLGYCLGCVRTNMIAIRGLEQLRLNFRAELDKVRALAGLDKS